MSFGNINQYFCVNTNGGNSTATLTPISSSSTLGVSNLPFPGIYGNTEILEPISTTQAGYLNIVNASNPQIVAGPLIEGLAKITLGSLDSSSSPTPQPGNIMFSAGGTINLLGSMGNLGSHFIFGPGIAGTATTPGAGPAGQIIFNSGGAGYTNSTGNGGDGGDGGTILVNAGGAGGEGTIGGNGGTAGYFTSNIGGSGGTGTSGNGGRGGDGFYFNASAGGGAGGNTSKTGYTAGAGGLGVIFELGGGGAGGNATSGTDGTGGPGATLTLYGGGSGGTGSNNGTNGIGAILTIGPDGTGGANPATTGATLLMQANNVGAQLQMNAPTNGSSPAILTMGETSSGNGGIIVTTGTATGPSLIIYESVEGATVNIGVDHLYSNTLTLGKTGIGHGGVVISSGASLDGGSITVNAGSSGGGTITAYGTITGGNISTGGTVSAGTVSAGTVTATGNISGGTLNTGPVTVTGNITATGTITGGNISTTGAFTVGTINATNNISTIGLNYNELFFEGIQSGNIPSSGNSVNLFSYDFSSLSLGYYLVTVTYMGSSTAGNAQYIASATVWVQVVKSTTGPQEVVFIGTPTTPTVVNSSIKPGPVTSIVWSVNGGLSLYLTGTTNAGVSGGTYNTKWSYLYLS